MDTMPPSEGGGAGSIPAEGTNKNEPVYLVSFLFCFRHLESNRRSLFFSSAKRLDKNGAFRPKGEAIPCLPAGLLTDRQAAEGTIG